MKITYIMLENCQVMAFEGPVKPDSINKWTHDKTVLDEQREYYGLMKKAEASRLPAVNIDLAFAADNTHWNFGSHEFKFLSPAYKYDEVVALPWWELEKVYQYKRTITNAWIGCDAKVYLSYMENNVGIEARQAYRLKRSEPVKTFEPDAKFPELLKEVDAVGAFNHPGDGMVILGEPGIADGRDYVPGETGPSPIHPPELQSEIDDLVAKWNGVDAVEHKTQETLESWIEKERNVLQNTSSLMWNQPDMQEKAVVVSKAMTITLEYIQEARKRGMVNTDTQESQTEEQKVILLVYQMFPNEPKGNCYARKTKNGHYQIGYTNDYPMQHGDGVHLVLMKEFLPFLII